MTNTKFNDLQNIALFSNLVEEQKKMIKSMMLSVSDFLVQNTVKVDRLVIDSRLERSLWVPALVYDLHNNIDL